MSVFISLGGHNSPGCLFGASEKFVRKMCKYICTTLIKFGSLEIFHIGSEFQVGRSKSWNSELEILKIRNQSIAPPLQKRQQKFPAVGKGHRGRSHYQYSIGQTAGNLATTARRKNIFSFYLLSSIYLSIVNHFFTIRWWRSTTTATTWVKRKKSAKYITVVRYTIVFLTGRKENIRR